MHLCLRNAPATIPHDLSRPCDRALQDGTNVNQWHWSEKDCLPWCRQRLVELLSGAELCATQAVSARITAVDSCTGEAIINLRKKKLIPSYELELKMSFEAEVQQSGGEPQTVHGKVRRPAHASAHLSS